MGVFHFGEQYGNPDVALAFFVCAVLVCGGTLQMVAARYGYVGLAWVRPRWQPWGGTLFGVILIVGGTAWFFVRHSDGIFRPGPAGLELLLLFGAAGLVAMAGALAGAAIIQTGVQPRGLPQRGHLIAEEVTLPTGTAWLYRPARGGGPFGAVCAVGTPGAGAEAVAPLATALAEAGLVALAVGWSDDDRWRPDEALALAGALHAANVLRDRPDVDAARVGAAGVGLGGDVALMMTAHDRRIRAVVAVAPWLDVREAAPGLSLLRDMTWPQAMRWQADLRRAARLVDPLAHASELGSRPVLLVTAADVGPPEQLGRSLAQLCRRLTTLRVGRLGQSKDATREIASWMTEQLEWTTSSSTF